MESSQSQDAGLKKIKILFFQVYCPVIHTAKNLFKWKIILNVYDWSYSYALMQKAQPELWAKKPPTELRIWAWGWSIEMQLYICWGVN